MARRKKSKKKNSLLGLILVIIVYFVYTYFGDLSFLVDDEKSVSGSSVIDSQVLSVEEVEGNLRVYYLNVGQADATLIENNGKYMLIDAGNNGDGDNLVSYFNSMGIDTFEYVIATHAHEDHIGGMDDIINNFTIKNFYMPDVITTTATFEDVVVALEDNNLSYSTPNIGDSFSFEGCNFKVLSVTDEDSDLNDNSIVLRLVYGNNSFLFMGDATSKIEKNILNLGINLKTDVYKVAHHGSEYSNTLAFLKEVNPTTAIISVGEGNSYGHPHEEALSNVKSVCNNIYRTDEDGTVIVDSDGDNIKVSFSNTNLDGW